MEALKDDRKGQHSIRVNDQWRICFKWADGDVFNVEIVNGKRSITADTALRLGKYFSVSPELWLDLQSDYDIRTAQRTVWPQIEPLIRAHAA